jgi:hypothetical protein
MIDAARCGLGGATANVCHVYCHASMSPEFSSALRLGGKRNGARAF